MTEQFSKWDAAEYLETEEDILLYLEACIEENGNDPAYLTKALGDIARARNMSKMAQGVIVTRAGLYKALSGKGNPSFDLISKIARNLGLQITFTSAKK